MGCLLAAVKAHEPTFAFGSIDVVLSKGDLGTLHGVVSFTRAHDSHKEYWMEENQFNRISVAVITDCRNAEEGHASSAYGETFATRSTAASRESCGVDSGDHYRVSTF